MNPARQIQKIWSYHPPWQYGLWVMLWWIIFPAGTLAQGRIDTALAAVLPTTEIHLATDLSRVSGLSSLDIYSLHQDRDGFIWIGHKSGASRYDGERFLNFTFAGNHPLGFIKATVEDSLGNVWLGGANGLFYYDGKIVHRASSKSVAIEGLHFDTAGNLWIVGLGFVPYYYSPTEWVAILGGEAPPTPRPIIGEEEWLSQVGTLRTFAADTDQNGDVWLALDNCHAVYRDGTLQPTWKDTNRLYRFTAVSAFRPDSIFWGSERTGLIMTRGGTSELKVAPTTYLIENKDTALYCLTATDILRLQNGQWTRLYDLDAHHSVYAQAFLVDREGNFWIGGIGCFLKISPSAFQNFEFPLFSAFKSNHGVGENEAGELLIGSHSGELVRFDGRSFITDKVLQLPSNSLIQDIYLDKRGWRWYATSLNGLFVERDGSVENFTTDEGLGDNTQYFFWEDSKGQLWTGGDNVLTRISISEMGRITFENHQTRNYTLRNVAFNAAFSDPRGGVWATSNQGLHYLQDGEMIRRSLTGREAIITGLSGVAQTENGDVWIGTAGDGLYQCSFEQAGNLGIIRKWTTREGLTDNTILDVITDQEGFVWALGRLGLCRLREGGIDHCLGPLDDWPVSSSPQSKLFETSRGVLWAVHMNGVQRLSPTPRRRSNAVAPQTFIREVATVIPKWGTRHFPGDVLADAEENWLTGRESVITFRFAGTNHYLPDQAFFRYRLKGFEEEWSEIDRSGVAVYRQLPAGEYRFEVKGYSAAGLADATPAVLSFRLPPPWYGTWWFRLLLLLLLTGATVWGISFLASRRIARREARELRQLDRFKSHFYTNITHEFRTPITVILGVSEGVEGGKMSPPMVKKTLTIIQRNGRRLLQLINGMLDLAKLESGHLGVQLVRQDVVSLLRYECDSYGALASAKGIEFSLECEPSSLEMDIDQEKFSVILSNLLMNAINYTPSGGRVVVMLKTLHPQGRGRLKVVVSDTGEGLSEVEKNQVFQRFYRTGKTQHTGTGIGLTVCREFVALLGGEMGVESEPGEGSQFWFTLPITREAPPAIEHALPYSEKTIDLSDRDLVEAEGKLSPKDQPRILIIEDDLDVADYLQSCFAKEYRCTHSINGAVGIKVALETIPDIIVSDVMMPELSGYDVCDKLKTDPRTDHIPIVLLTARVEIDDKIKGITRGADAYLTKPFSRLELLARVEQLLGIRRRLQQKYTVDLVDESLREGTPLPDTFLRRAEQCVLNHLNDESFGGPELANALHLSKAQTYRKLKALTGLSTALFIRNVRLEKARHLLRDRSLSVSEIAYAVGYRTSAYFSQVFRGSYGKSPTEYRKKMGS